MASSRARRLEHLIEEALDKTPQDGEEHLRTHLASEQSALRDALDFLHQYHEPAGPNGAGLALFDKVRDAAAEILLAEQNPADIKDVPKLSAPQEFAGDYVLLEELGRGGMGIVYKAHQKSLNRLVALKTILLGRCARVFDRQRLQIEAEALAKIRHEGIVTAYHTAEHEGQLFFTMEFIEGPNLQSLAKQNALDPRRSAELVRQIAEAVQAAHQNGIIHRDLKPTNVLVTRSGLPKVTDFGVAKIVGENSTLSITGDIIGSPSYMSPEQAAGRNKEVGPGSDVYSLGAILYELLTGRPPFLGSDRLQTLKQVQRTEPVPVSRSHPDVPKDLETICLKCLRKEPQDRYLTAQKLADDLDRFLKGKPIEARPPLLLRRCYLWIKRNPLLASLLALVVAFLSVSNWYTKEAAARVHEAAGRKVAEKAEREAQLAYTNEAQAKQRESSLRAEIQRTNYFRQIQLSRRAWQENQLARAISLLEECPEELRRWEWFYLERLCRSGDTILGDFAGSVSAVAFSADASKVAAYGTGALKVWDVANGTVLLSQEKLRPAASALLFSEDSNRLLQHAKAPLDQLLVWDLSRDECIQTMNLRGSGMPAIDVSPDGKYYLVRSPGGASTLDVCSTETGDCKAIINPAASGGAAFCDDSQQVLTWTALTPSVQLFSATDGKRLVNIDNEHLGIRSAAANPRYVALGFDDGTVSFWDSATGQHIWTARPHTERITSLSLTASGRALTTSVDASAKVIDIARREVIDSFRGHRGAVLSGAWSPDEMHVVTGGADRTARLWRVEADHQMLAVRGPQPFVIRIAVSPDGKFLASNSDGHTVSIYDISSMQPIGRLEGQAGDIRAIAYDDQGTTIVTGDAYGRIRLWNAVDGGHIRAFEPLSGGVTAVAVNTGVGIVAAGCIDGTLTLWNCHTEDSLPVASMAIGNGAIRSLKFSRDGSSLAAVMQLATLRIINRLSENPPSIIRFPNNQGEVTSAEFLPDGNRIAASGPEGVQLWDLASTRLIRTYGNHTARVNCVAAFPDGQRLVSASDDRTLKVWDTQSNEELLALPGHGVSVDRVMVSEDGARIVSIAADGEIRIWLAN